MGLFVSMTCIFLQNMQILMSAGFPVSEGSINEQTGNSGKEDFMDLNNLNLQKCGIIGCGAVGATAAHTLLGSGLFNEMVLIDINHKKAEGEAMDIGHGVPFVKPVNIYAGDYKDLADAYLVIVTAGANQMPGET